MSRAELLWVIDPDAAARERAHELAPQAQIASELGLALQDDRVQAVVIASPASTHVDLGLACLHARRHVLVEKPLAPTLEGARRLVEAARARDRQLCVGHICVFMPGVLDVRERISHGDLGVLRVVDADRTSVPARQPDVDVLWDLGTHDLSILNSWVGQSPVAVAATGAVLPPFHRVSVATATLWYPGDVVGRIRVSWHGALKIRRVSASGDGGVAVFDDAAEKRSVNLTLADGSSRAEQVQGSPPLLAELESFLDAVEHGRASPVDGLSGLEVIRVLTAMQWSLDHGGQRIALEALDSVDNPA